MDQHYALNPQELFDKSMDDLVVDLESPVILEGILLSTSVPRLF